MMFGKNKSSSKSENEEVRNRYAVFVQQHGELFMDSQEALTQEDILDIEKRKPKLLRSWIIISVVVGGLVMATFIFESSHDFETTVDALVVLVIVLGGGAILVMHFNRALRLNEKRVMQGVVTAKIRIGRLNENNGYYLELSRKQKLKVSSGDYKICSLGEIVRIEMLADDMLIKRKIVKLGKI